MKKNNINKEITQNRSRRLRLAKEWIGTYTGKNIVRGYAKHYRVDLLCAINDLKILGIGVAAHYKEAIKRLVNDRAMQKRKKKEMAENQGDIGYSGDEHLSFIVGFTSGGAAYGLSREEGIHNKLPNRPQS